VRRQAQRDAALDRSPSGFEAIQSAVKAGALQIFAFAGPQSLMYHRYKSTKDNSDENRDRFRPRRL
jgi:hypothetical protein